MLEPAVSRPSEVAPLLQRTVSTTSTNNVETQSRYSIELRVVKQFLKRRFWWFCLVGLAAIITLQLSFLPRTSPNRDFRRWHNLHLTKTDVKRIFLVQLKMDRPDADGFTIEEHINFWLGNFSDINAKNHASLAASDAPDIATFVETQMRSLGFKTRVHTYPIMANLHSPVTLSLQLYDTKSARKLYTASLDEPSTATPAYFTFGRNGSVLRGFVFANSGSPADFHLLLENNISVKDKIVIFGHPLTCEYSLADKIALAGLQGCAAVVVFSDAEVETAISRNFKPVQVPDAEFRLPISYKAVQPILDATGPPSGPFLAWKHSPVCLDHSLNLLLTTTFSPNPLNATNIVSTIKGVLNDGEIIVGASRDSLTSSNPLSGHTIMLEVMRRFRNLKRLGWVPLRTIRFVSWDASRSGALGSLANVDDSDVFKKNLPVLAYINLDEDVITGSHLSVDSNPLFNHVLKQTARFVPFPKSSPYFKRLLKNQEESVNENLFAMNLFETLNLLDGNARVRVVDEDDDYDDGDETSLYHYWYNQDGVYINNKLGNVFAGKDVGTFQLAMDAPTINVKFGQSPNHNDSIYVPESAMYSKKWVETEVDKTYELHGLLVRFLGLLVLSLEEHEVVDTRTATYFARVQEFFDDVKNDNRARFETWAQEVVDRQLLEKSSLFADLKERTRIEGGTPPVSANFSEVVEQMDVLTQMLVDQSRVFDQYNQDVEDLWTTDFPWYKMLRKVHIYAKFKVLNYKLLRLEKNLNTKDDDNAGDGMYHHFMYEVPHGVHKLETKLKRGAFGSLYEAVESGSLDSVVKLLVAKYEKLSAAYKRIT